MGHIRLGTLPHSKKWRQVVELHLLRRLRKRLHGASERDLDGSTVDPSIQFISKLLIELPLMARSPGFEESLK